MDIEKGTQSIETTDTPPTANSPNPSPDEEPTLPKWRLTLLTISICIGLFLSLLDTTIVATALFTIGVSLNSESSINWVALAYTLAYLGCCVVFARIADIIGRRNAYILAFLIFFAFSLGCGFSRSLEELIACRALQGIGGSGLYALTFVILPEISPPKLVAALGGVAGAVVAVSGVLGPVLGGIITHYTTWRWVFWINAPIGIIPLVLFCVAWPKPNQIRPIQRRPVKELDILGCVLIIAASVLVVFSLQEGGIRANAWGTAIFLAPLILGCLCWGLLLGWQVLVARFWEDSIATVFPLNLIKRRVYLGYLISTLLMGFPYFLVIYSLPLRFQVVNGKTPLISGISLLPMLFASAIGSTIGGVANAKRNNAFPLLTLASCFMVLGTGLMSTLSNTVEIAPKTYGFQVFIGFGFGLTVSTASLGVSLEADLKDLSVAQGMVAQFRVLGGSIGIAASTAILGVTERRELSGILTSKQLAALGSSTSHLNAAQLHAVKQAYSDAFNKDLRVCAIISGVSLLVTFMTFQRNPKPMMERRKEQLIEEKRRQRDLRSAKAIAPVN